MGAGTTSAATYLLRGVLAGEAQVVAEELLQLLLLLQLHRVREARLLQKRVRVRHGTVTTTEARREDDDERGSRGRTREKTKERR